MDVIEAIKARQETKKFKRDLIPEEKLKAVMNAMRLASSAKNLQPWKFIIVRDEDLKRKLVGACGNQKFIAEAPIVVIACGLVGEAYPYLGYYMSSYPVDVAIALDNLMLAAHSEGLGTSLVFDFHEEKVKELFAIPQDVKVVAITPLGFPEAMDNPGRKHISEIVCYDKYE